MAEALRPEPIVRFEHVTKTFPGIRALDDVSFSIQEGEVHCLLGENGAGKSTLMKILTGVYHAESGSVYLRGKKVEVGDIHQAQQLRIGTVFQENSLIPHMTVAENVFLTREIKNHAGLIDWNRMYRMCPLGKRTWSRTRSACTGQTAFRSTAADRRDCKNVLTGPADRYSG